MAAAIGIVTRALGEDGGEDAQHAMLTLADFLQRDVEKIDQLYTQALGKPLGLWPENGDGDDAVTDEPDNPALGQPAPDLDPSGARNATGCRPWLTPSSWNKMMKAMWLYKARAIIFLT